MANVFDWSVYAAAGAALAHSLGSRQAAAALMAREEARHAAHLADAHRPRRQWQGVKENDFGRYF